MHKAVRRSPVRTSDRAHSVLPSLEAVVELRARHLHETNVGTPSVRHGEDPLSACPPFALRTQGEQFRVARHAPTRGRGNS